jgi:hypothetical protein
VRASVSRVLYRRSGNKISALTYPATNAIPTRLGSGTLVEPLVRQIGRPPLNRILSSASTAGLFCAAAMTKYTKAGSSSATRVPGVRRDDRAVDIALHEGHQVPL